MSVLPSARPARRRTLTPYVLLWVALAGLSAAYLTFLGVRPDVVAALRAAAPDPQEALNETKQSVERALADLDPLRQSVGEMKTDVANLKIGAQEAADRDKILLEKVELLEHRTSANDETAQASKGPVVASVSPPSSAAKKSAVEPAPGGKVSVIASVPPPPAAPKKSAAVKIPPANVAAAEPGAAAPQVASAAAKVPAAPKVAGAEPAAATPQVAQETAEQKPTAQKPANAIETGSIAHGVKAAAAATKPLPVGILLATGPSVDALRLSWTILNDRHADAVRSLHARYVVSGKSAERTYGLVAGPFETIDDAKAVCKTMADRGMPCELSTYRGNAL